MGKPEQPSNNELLFSTLATSLTRPEVIYVDANYLEGAMPDGTEYKIDDYFAYTLKDAHPSGVTKMERERLLYLGKVCMDILLKPEGGTAARRLYLVGRPADIREGFGVLEYATADGIDPSSTEPFTYSSVHKHVLPDPFEDPHLLALYRHLADTETQ